MKTLKRVQFILTLLWMAFIPMARAQTIANPSFELDSFTAYPGYSNAGGNGGIDGWVPFSAQVGLNPAAGNPFANNGATPNGTNVAFLQGVNSLATTISNLTAGTAYLVTFNANSRTNIGVANFSLPIATWSLNGGAYTSFTVNPPVGGSNPYYTNYGVFTATGPTAALVISNGQTTGDSTLLVDNFSIITYVPLGITNLLAGPATGSNSVQEVVNAPWTATANNSWLHLGASYQSGGVSTNVIFKYDANSGATRSGTLTIGGETLTVTQAGSTYVAANPVTTLVSSNATTPVNLPWGVAVDAAGNVYFADSGHNAIKKWIVASNLVSTLVSTGLNEPASVAVDGAGNIYIADAGSNSIVEWTAANSTLITLVASNATTSLNFPCGVAVDTASNVYIADANDNAIDEWMAADSNLVTLVSSNATTPLNSPEGIAVDGAGNVYIADSGDNAIKTWLAVNGSLTTLVASNAATPLNFPKSVAVDHSGNVYIADANDNVIKKWTAASNTVSTLVSGLSLPQGVAVDGAGNVYLSDANHNAIKEQPWAFVDGAWPSAQSLAQSPLLPGPGTIQFTSPVLPATANLTAPFAPILSQPWVTVATLTNGLLSVNFTANTNSSSRSANITLLGVSTSVSQTAVTPPVLSGTKKAANGTLSFIFTNTQGSGISFSVFTTTNVLLPLSQWTDLGAPTQNGNTYQVSDPAASSHTQRFYRVRVP